MTLRAKLLFGALACVLLAALGVRLALVFHMVEEDVPIPPGMEAQRNPLLAAQRFLAKRGVPAVCLDLLEELPPPGGALLLGTPDLSLPASTTGRIAAWVREGGHLIASPCQGTGWMEPESSGAHLLEALDVVVECLAYDENIVAQDVKVAFGDPAESLTIVNPFVWVTD